MKTINGNFESTYIINKSKFISFAYPVGSEEDCKVFLEEISKQYPDATHICFAYLLTSPRIEKCSDNGEPTGTAGKPILEVIKKKKLENVLCIVVRYFGGKKLGAGGLVRAYTTSANDVLEMAEVIEKKNIFVCRLIENVQNGEKTKNKLIGAGAIIRGIVYKENVEIIFEIDDLEKVQEFEFTLMGEENGNNQN